MATYVVSTDQTASYTATN